MTNVLEVKGLAVEFDGFKALDGVDFTVAKGELRFLIGPNGAGKTTLIDCITGLTKPTAGSVTFEGKSLDGLAEHQRVRLGIGRSFQAPTVFDTLTVADNLDLAETFRTPMAKLFLRRRRVSPGVSATLARVSLTSTGAVCGISGPVQPALASTAVSMPSPMRPRPSVS